MATLRERMRARREAERRKLRIFTIGVSDDDLRVIAKHDGYQGALTTDHEQQAQAQSLHHRRARRPIGQVTALRRLQRRFSDGVTAVETPENSVGVVPLPVRLRARCASNPSTRS
jgi:hypothetical protein